MNKIQKTKFKHFKKPNSYKSKLDVNMKGFLCSCNNREKDCVKEAYNLLNKYADILYPSAPEEAPKGPAEEIEDELKNEIVAYKSAKVPRRFQEVESGARNFLFIKTEIEDPVHLAERIISEVSDTKIQQTKFLIRLIPVEVTCKAYVKDISCAFKPLAEKYFKQEAKTFSIILNHRNNNTLDKDEVIKAVAEIVNETREDNKVNLKEAELSVVIEVIKGIALISIIPNYLKHKKYNLLSLSETVPGDKEESDQN